MVTKSERNGPVFRFFMDLGDAGMIENRFITLYIFSWVGKDSEYYSWFLETTLFFFSYVDLSRNEYPKIHISITMDVNHG